MRPAVTALAPAPVATEPASKPAVEAAADAPPVNIGRSPARYLWVRLLARISAAFPLTCPPCGAEMRIIAFISEAVDVRAILEHIGEPTTPPRIASARGPPSLPQQPSPTPPDRPIDRPMSASRSPSGGQKGLERSLDSAPGRGDTSA
jgi:hypothetical protein